ncbi:hypothetical protein ACIBJI_09470 [Nocardia sp. NPDC050408]
MTGSSWGNICAEATVPVGEARLCDELVDGVAPMARSNQVPLDVSA